MLFAFGEKLPHLFPFTFSISPQKLPDHTRDPAIFHLLTCAIAVSIPPTFSIVLLALLTILFVFIGRELYAEYAIPAAQNAAVAPAAVIKVFAILFILKSSVIFVNFIFPCR